MESRKPTYTDLLEHITVDELLEFIRRLKKTTGTGRAVIATDEIDQPIYIYKTPRPTYFHTALCYAAYLGDLKIARALLNVGADPNLTSNSCLYGSPLMIATQLKTSKEAMIGIILDAKCTDVYVMDGMRRTAFHSARGNTDFILRLLSRDPVVDSLPAEEKKSIVQQIATATTSRENGALYRVLSETVGTKCDYSDADSPALLAALNEECGFTQGQPLGGIVLSYLFKKPPTLAAIELEAAREKQAETQARGQTSECVMS